jgi:hypothetical protein
MSSKRLTNRVKELEKVVRELAHERDLYRREWLRAKEEAVAVQMTDEECEAIVKQGITLDQVIAEIEQMQNGRPENGN